MYKIKFISFKNWKEYEDIVNALAEDGWIIDETLEKNGYQPLKTSQHTVRLKNIHHGE